MAKTYYRGFSTRYYVNNNGKTTSISNIDVVKDDLLNHIFTIKGERLMMPGFGTRIPLMAFEPLDKDTIKIVKDDLNEVFAYDPRVKLLGLEVVALPDNNALVAFADLLYVEFDVRETLRIEIPSGQ